VPQDRLRKYSDENQELARNLKKEMERVAAMNRPTKVQTSQKRKGNASGRGSEERNSTPALGNKKRGRDLDTEKVCFILAKFY
jgi:mortality factor 4-like protein 1